jgi:hypothetical protein
MLYLSNKTKTNNDKTIYHYVTGLGWTVSPFPK